MDSGREERLLNCSKKLQPLLEKLYKQREKFCSLLKNNEKLYDSMLFFNIIPFELQYKSIRKFRSFYIRPRLHFPRETNTNRENCIENKMYFSLDISNRKIFFKDLWLYPLEFVSYRGENSFNNFLIYDIDENVARIHEPTFLTVEQIEQCIDILIECFDFKREFAKKLEEI